MVVCCVCCVLSATQDWSPASLSANRTHVSTLSTMWADANVKVRRCFDDAAALQLAKYYVRGQGRLQLPLRPRLRVRVDLAIAVAVALFRACGERAHAVFTRVRLLRHRAHAIGARITA